MHPTRLPDVSGRERFPLSFLPVLLRKQWFLPLLLLILAGGAVQPCRGQHFIKSLNAYRPDPNSFTVAGNYVFFVYDDDVHGSEVWRSDGTTAGTFMVKDIMAGRGGSAPQELFSFKGALYFAAFSYGSGGELWKSDGTPGGTVLLKNIKPDHLAYNSSNAGRFTVFNDQLYFFASEDGDNAQDLWKTDGTAGGTVKVKEFNAYAYGAAACVAHNTLYFVYANSLWQSDGTSAGTTPVMDLGAIGPVTLTTTGNALYLTGPNRLWTVGARGAAPVLLKTFNVPLYGQLKIANQSNLEGTLYFSVQTRTFEGPHTDDLWKSDGTPEGTVLVKSFPCEPYLSDSFIKCFTPFKGELYFRNNSKQNYSLWKSNGTGAGTVRVADVNLGNVGEKPAVVGDYLYFPAAGPSPHGFGGSELWRTDGTAAGTVEVMDLNPEATSNPSRLIDYRGTLHFVANEGKGLAFWSAKPAPALVVKGAGNVPAGTGAVNFGKAPLDALITRTITLQNAGLLDLVLADVRVAGENFRLVGSFPGVITPGQSVVLSVGFYPGTPGNKSGLFTITTNDPTDGVTRIQLTGEALPPVAQGDFEALVALYKATNGTKWYAHAGWDTTQNTVGNHWSGVTVENGRVVALRLNGYGLEGVLPEKMTGLTALQVLALNSNRLKGSLPAWLGQLKQLQELELNSNRFTGSLPPELGDIDSLRGLQLTGNALTGNVPVQLARLTKLQWLILGSNQLSGAFPAAVAAMPTLRTLFIDNNAFTSLPALTEGPDRYRNLAFARNRLVFKDIEPYLKSLWSTAMYTPQQPVGEPAYLTLTDLTTSLALTLPASVVNDQYQYQWTFNGFNIAGANAAAYTLSGATLKEGVYSCKITYANVSELTLERAPVYVQKTVSDEEFRALAALYAATGGGQWTNRAGWNTTVNTVSNAWFGVKVANGHVVELNLGNGNNLQGQLPAELGNLRYLTTLSIHGNPGLTGSLPASLTNLSELTRLYLSNNGLGGPLPGFVGNLAALQELGLSSNRFTGTIPASFAQLRKLKQLFLFGNQLDGPLPAHLGDMTALTVLQLSHNGFNGTIPAEWANLVNLQNLYLDHNQLSGEIPAWLGSLSALGYLELSHNQFSGTLPAAFASFLTRTGTIQLVLDDNRLEGLPVFNRPAADFWFGNKILLRNNRFTFEDLAPNQGLIYSYTPQDSVGAAEAIAVAPGQTVDLTLPADVTHPGNRYQWTRDGQDIRGANGITCRVEGETALQLGTYSCRITNPAMPSLTLYQRAIRLTGDLPPGATMTLRTASVREKQPAGTLVGTLAVAGPGEPVTLSILESDPENAFVLDGNALRTAKPLDHDLASVYTLRVKATWAGGSTTATFAVAVLKEEAAPAVAPCTEWARPLAGALYDVAFAGKNVVFAVGYNGQIIKSADGGNRWQQVPLGPLPTLRGVAFPDSLTGYAVGDYGTLLKTDDGGDNWRQLSTGVTASLYSVSFTSAGKGHAVGYGGLILRTDDGGESWRSVGPSYYDLSEVFFVNENTGFAVGPGNHLIRTTNGGSNWTRVDMGFLGFSVDIYSVFFTDPQTGFITTEAGIYKTTDGGSAWRKVQEGGAGGTIRFASALDGYMVGGYYQSALRTTDGGETWTALDVSVTGRLYGIAFNPDGTKGCLVGGGSSGWSDYAGRAIYVTAGAAWQPVSVGLGENPGPLAFSDELTGYLSTSPTGLYKTTDGGLTWKLLPTGATGYASSLYFTGPSTGYFTTQDKLYKTTDAGASWAAAYTSPNERAHLRGLQFVDAQTAFMQGGALEQGLYKTTDGGQSWQLKLGDGDFYAGVRAFHFPTGGTGYAVLSGGKLYKTTDAGDNWTQLSKTGGFLEYLAVHFLDERRGFLGGKGGKLFSTRDGGATWDSIPNRFGTNISHIRFRSESDGYVVAGNSLFRTRDGGSTWEPALFLSDGITGLALTAGETYVAGPRGGLAKATPGSLPLQPDYITGEKQVCVDNLAAYSVPAAPGVQYRWELSGGGALEYNQDKALVRWTQSGTFLLKATPLNGCGDGTASQYRITVADRPGAGFTGADTVCRLATEQYQAAAQTGRRYYWQVSGGEPLGTVTGPVLRVHWLRAGIHRVTLSETNEATGCRKDSVLRVVVQEGPGRISLRDSTVRANGPAGTVVSTFATEYGLAPGAGFRLVAGAGDNDNARFTVAGDTLRTRAVLPPSAAPLRIRVEYAAPGNCTLERELLVYVWSDVAANDVAGSVFTREGAPMSGAVVTLLRYGQGTYTQAAQATLTSPAFAFKDLPAGTYTVRVTPDTLAYPAALPTYYGDGLALAGAKTIAVPAAPAYHNVVVQEKQQSPGTLVLEGVVVENGAYAGGRITQGKDATLGTPLAGVAVYLVSTTNGRAAGAARSAADGTFALRGLAAGAYYLLVDYANLPMDTATYRVTLSGRETTTRVTAVVGTDKIYKVLNATTGLETPAALQSLTVSPNPATQTVRIRLDNAVTGRVSVRITDVAGRVWFAGQYAKAGEAWEAQIPLETVPGGVLVIETTLNGYRAIRRLVKL